VTGEAESAEGGALAECEEVREYGGKVGRDINAMNVKTFQRGEGARLDLSVACESF
jgi:hypothetical protein